MSTHIKISVHHQQKYMRLSLLLTAALLFGFGLMGCEPADSQGGCLGCHMDKEKLKEIADPIETTESTGEG